MKQIFLLAVILMLCSSYGFSQSNVQIKDIYVQPITGIDSTSTGNQLEMMFKMNNQADASVLHLQFGTAQDLGDVISIEATIIEQGGQYYVSHQGEDILIVGYDSSVTVELTESQESAYGYITLFIEDVNGEESNKLYFIK